MIGIAAAAAWQGFGLDLGTLRQLGPGMFPRVVAVLLGLCGGVLLVRALLARASSSEPSGSAAPPAPGTGRSKLRAPVFLIAAAAAFGLSVRPLGLVVAAPLGILLVTLASPESRRGESAWLALGLSAFCVVLFRQLLSLPIPLAPWLIGY